MRKFHHGETLGFENTRTICVVCNMGPLISSFLLLAYKAAEAYAVVKIQRTQSLAAFVQFSLPLSHVTGSTLSSLAEELQ